MKWRPMEAAERQARIDVVERVRCGLATAQDADQLAAWLHVHRTRLRPHALTDAQVIDLRETWQRWLHAGTAHGTGPDGKGYGLFGEIYGVSGSTARDIVQGRTRRAAGGPIDGGAP